MRDLLEPGVYIGLCEDDYHADPSLGGSALKSCVYQPIEYWWQSAHNPHRPEPKETETKRFGRAVHAMMLEGRAAYEDRYYSEGFDPDAHPDALDTMDDMKAYLRELKGMASELIADEPIMSGLVSDLDLRLGGNRDDLIERIRRADPDKPFLADARAAFEREHEGMTQISASWFRRLSIFVALRERDPKLVDLFSEGLPEVSVIWEESGLRCSARFDWLRADQTVDLKTFSARQGQTARDAIFNTIPRLRYDLQQAHYEEARRQLRSLPVIGGTDAERDYIAKCAETPNAPFRFLFVKTSGAPTVRIVDADVFSDAAKYDRANLMQQLARHVEAYGLDAPWVTGAEDLKVEFVDVPAWMGLEGVA